MYLLPPGFFSTYSYTSKHSAVYLMSFFPWKKMLLFLVVIPFFKVGKSSTRRNFPHFSKFDLKGKQMKGECKNWLI